MEISIAVGKVRGPLALDEFIGQVQSAADSGFGTVWSAQALGWDALTALAVAGALVPDLALGTAVVPTPQRHPLTLASQALTVQAVTGNRLTLGIGAGIGRMVESMFGLPAGRPARRMREYVSALRPLLRGEAVDYRGETLTAVGAVSVSGAHAPPLLLAALGPEMLRVAGELADGAVTWMAGPRTLADHVVPTVTRAAETAGRPAPRILAGVIVCVTDDEEGARAGSASGSRWPAAFPNTERCSTASTRRGRRTSSWSATRRASSSSSAGWPMPASRSASAHRSVQRRRKTARPDCWPRSPLPAPGLRTDGAAAGACSRADTR